MKSTTSDNKNFETGDENKDKDGEEEPYLDARAIHKYINKCGKTIKRR